MKAKRILDLVEAYEAKLKSLSGAKAKEFSSTGILPARTDVVNHSLWMCQHIRGLVAEERIEKASKWIKWVQGSLWASGLASIDELRQED